MTDGAGPVTHLRDLWGDLVTRGACGIWVGPSAEPTAPPHGQMAVRGDPLPLAGALALEGGDGLVGVVAPVPGDRHPAVLAKHMTTVDVLSQGRAGLLIESRGVAPAHLAEAVKVCRALFSHPAPTVAGAHYRVTEAVNLPPPLRPEGPMLLADPGPGWRATEPSSLAELAEVSDGLVVAGTLGELAEVASLREGHAEVPLIWRVALKHLAAGDRETARQVGADLVLVRVDPTAVSDASVLERLG
jgi:alkanesulfonate monooxygenase SsuD/methylene tetrahydromethanopterin reductase-like flavin-dependent oxidoreductase (luciferase family)